MWESGGAENTGRGGRYIEEGVYRRGERWKGLWEKGEREERRKHRGEGGQRDLGEGWRRNTDKG